MGSRYQSKIMQKFDSFKVRCSGALLGAPCRLCLRSVAYTHLSFLQQQPAEVGELPGATHCLGDGLQALEQTAYLSSKISYQDQMILIK